MDMVRFKVLALAFPVVKLFVESNVPLSRHFFLTVRAYRSFGVIFLHFIHLHSPFRNPFTESPYTFNISRLV